MVQGAVYDAVNAIDGGHRPYLQGISAAPGASQAAAAATAAHGVLVGAGGELGLLDRDTGLRNELSPGRIHGGRARTTIEKLGSTCCSALLLGRLRSRTAPAPWPQAWQSARMLQPKCWMFAAVTAGTRSRRPPSPWARSLDSGGRRRRSVNDPFGWVRRRRNLRGRERHAVPQQGAERPEEWALREGVRRGEGTRRDWEPAVRRTAGDGGLLPAARRGDVRPLASHPRLWGEPLPRRAGTVPRPGLAVSSGRGHHVLERQGALELLASADCDPSRRRRRQPEDRRRYELDVLHSCAAVPGSRIRLQLRGRLDDRGSRAFLRPGADGVHAVACGTSRRVTAGTLPLSRPYEHFRDVCDDTIDARVYQGIHFRSADEAGVKIGRDVARWVSKHALERAK